MNGAAAAVPQRFLKRHVSANAFMRLGLDLSRKLRFDRPDLLHVQYTAPLACPVPVVASVHDISFLEQPEYFRWPRALQLRMTVKRTIERAAKVITPSEFSRAAIMRAYGLDETSVRVVPIAVSPSFRPIQRASAARFVAARFGIGNPFVLTVGDLQPRKNQAGLIDAFERLVGSNPSLPHRLVIVGKSTWYADRIIKAAKSSRVAGRIHFTGFVTDDDLLQLYNASDLLAFPSFYEGFGLPVLEAMACGRAVVSSNTSAIPEVADGAALLFDPKSPDDIARAMRDVLLDSELRSRLERLGQQRASQFSWDRTARQTLDIYYEIAGAPKMPAAVPAGSVPASRL
jgi:glycosyltransferase involved in cell wall biosynthesis